jgi:hypothetical protein
MNPPRATAHAAMMMAWVLGSTVNLRLVGEALFISCSIDDELELPAELLVELLYSFHARLALGLGYSIVGRQPLLALSADREVMANAGGPHDVHW